MMNIEKKCLRQNFKILYNFENGKLKYKKMKKNSGKIFESVQVDPISGDYYLIIPESVANELSWYEDTEIGFKIEGNEVILAERTD
jgi:hypothetical protein